MSAYNSTIKWDTSDEIAWLRRIGETANGTVTRHNEKRVLPDRKTLLKSYIETAQHRARWEAIDKYAAVAEARALLAEA